MVASMGRSESAVFWAWLADLMGELGDVGGREGLGDSPHLPQHVAQLLGVGQFLESVNLVSRPAC